MWPLLGAAGLLGFNFHTANKELLPLSDYHNHERSNFWLGVALGAIAGTPLELLGDTCVAGATVRFGARARTFRKQHHDRCLGWDELREPNCVDLQLHQHRSKYAGPWDPAATAGRGKEKEVIFFLGYMIEE